MTKTFGGVDVMAIDTCDSPIPDGDGRNQNRSAVDPALQQVLIACLEDLQAVAQLEAGQLLVVGASSSEVIGQRIGTATSMEIGRLIVETILSFARRHGFDVAFQCCEHLNRSLVVEKVVQQMHGFERVQAVPIPGAGGAVASAAYFQFQDPCLVSSITADAGIDIGDTLIGMHLKRVAVPVRGRFQSIGEAHVTMARTRPPLVGGSRAVYDKEEALRRIQM
jgi:uncharacterized protein (TIGR01440 family)